MLTKTKQDNMKPLKQMNFDPMTGAPIIQPGPQNVNTARSSEMYEVANAGYPQGSMVNAINANPMMANVPSQGLMQKPMPTGDEGKGIRSLPSSVQEKMGYDPLSQKKNCRKK